MAKSAKKENRYQALIASIFKNHYRRGSTAFEFERAEIESVAKKLSVTLPKNLGDLIYSFRYRVTLPPEIKTTEPAGFEWLIEPAGRAKYRFSLAKIVRIAPSASLIKIKVPDATPAIIADYAQSDEQALLAKVRYNRLVDVFLGITAYSLQNHLRTTVAGMGQIEIDEIYVGLNRNGAHFIVPVQAKGGNDKLSVIQSRQDAAWCAQEFENLICRPVSAQFMPDGTIAMFELQIDQQSVAVVDEKHYQLVPPDSISDEELRRYRAVRKP